MKKRLITSHIYDKLTGLTLKEAVEQVTVDELIEGLLDRVSLYLQAQHMATEAGVTRSTQRMQDDSSIKQGQGRKA